MASKKYKVGDKVIILQPRTICIPTVTNTPVIAIITNIDKTEYDCKLINANMSKLHQDSLHWCITDENVIEATKTTIILFGGN